MRYNSQHPRDALHEEMGTIMSEWLGDEEELLWEELDDLKCQEADLQNDAEWLESYGLIKQKLPPNCSFGEKNG